MQCEPCRFPTTFAVQPPYPYYSLYSGFSDNHVFVSGCVPEVEEHILDHSRSGGGADLLDAHKYISEIR